MSTLMRWDEFVDSNGKHCPRCGSEKIDPIEYLEADCNEAWQKTQCYSCGSTWLTVYELVGYIEFEEGKDDED